MLAQDRECEANGSVAPLCISPDYTVFMLVSTDIMCCGWRLPCTAVVFVVVVVVVVVVVDEVRQSSRCLSPHLSPLLSVSVKST